MGLLDFFSKNGSTTAQGDNTNPPPAVPDFAGIQQSYTNQSLANVSYPMASGNPYGTTTPVVPQANVTQDQSQQYPGLTNMPAQQQPMAVSPAPVMDIMDMGQAPQPMQMPEVNPMPNQMASVQESPMPTIDQSVQGDVPSYEYADPSKHPVLPTVMPNQGHTEVMPEGIKVTTYEPQGTVQQPEFVAPQTEMPVENTVMPTPEASPAQEAPMPDLTAGMMPQVEQMPQQEPVISSLPAMDTMPVVQDVMATPEVTPVESVVTPELNATNNFEATQLPPMEPIAPEVPMPVVEGITPIETAPVVPEPEPKTDPINDGLEIGVGMDVQPQTDLSPMPEIAEVSGAALTPEVIPELPSMEVTPESIPEVVEETPVTPAVEMPVETLPEVTETPVEEKKESVVETTPVAQAVEFEMSYFKTVGFIGLNTPQPNSKVVEKVADLASKLAEHAEVFILDSAKGYAKNVFEKAKAKDIELMGMYLKPFHSGYSDEADLGEYDNFTVMMFSNSADKIKNIIKESDMLVMPEISGLNNLGTFFDIWSTNSMYPGQNKPLILLGKGWTAILTQLKSLFKLSETDLGFVTVCQTTEEALAKITELDKSFITKEVKQPRKIIDLREEDDEEGLFV